MPLYIPLMLISHGTMGRPQIISWLIKSINYKTLVVFPIKPIVNQVMCVNLANYGAPLWVGIPSGKLT